MASDKKSIIFRLDDYFREVLETQAAAAGLPKNLYARSLLTKVLDGDGGITELKEQMKAVADRGERLDARLSAIEGQVSELRKELSVSVETLLQVAGRLSAEQSRSWIVDNLDP